MSRVLTELREDAGAPSGAVLSRSTVMTVRRVLNARRDGWLLDERLATAARMAAEDAQRLGLDAAGMLVALERERAALDEVRQLSVFDAEPLRNRLVTLSIRAFYQREGAVPPEGDPRERAGRGRVRSAA